MSFAEYRDSPLLHTFDLLKDRYAFFQNGGFEQPCIATLDQEVVILRGRHVNQNFHDEKLNMRVAKFKSCHIKF
jgi:hypothetical protein